MTFTNFYFGVQESAAVSNHGVVRGGIKHDNASTGVVTSVILFPIWNRRILPLPPNGPLNKKTPSSFQCFCGWVWN